MACGDRFRSMVVTSDGYTLDNPFGAVGIYPYDYYQWKDLARRFVEMADEHFAALGEYEETRGTYPRWNEILPMKNGMSIDYKDLPSIVLTGWTGEAAISAAQEVIAQAACVMERSDDALIAYGQKAPVVPGLVPKPREPRDDGSMPWWVGVLVGGGLTLAVGSYVYAKRRKRREPPSQRRSLAREGRPAARRPEGAEA